MKTLMIVQWFAIAILLLYGVAATTAYENVIGHGPSQTVPSQSVPNVVTQNYGGSNGAYQCQYTYTLGIDKPTGFTCK